MSKVVTKTRENATKRKTSRITRTENEATMSLGKVWYMHSLNR